MKENKKTPKNKLLVTGVVGTVIAILCCFTPILVVALGFLGLGAAVAYLDIVLIPAVLLFVGMIIYALLKRKSEGVCAK